MNQKRKREQKTPPPPKKSKPSSCGVSMGSSLFSNLHRLYLIKVFSSYIVIVLQTPRFVNIIENIFATNLYSAAQKSRKTKRAALRLLNFK